MNAEMVDHPDHDTLAAYCLGGLGARETATYDEHLSTCDSCRAYADELVAVREMLALVPPELVLDDPLMTGEAAEPPARRPAARRGATRRDARTWLSVAAVAAAIVVGAFVIPNVVSNGTSSTPVPTATVITQAGSSTSVGAVLRLVPAAASVGFDLRLTNVPGGTTLTVVADLTDGSALTAGRWHVPSDGRAGEVFELEHSVPVTVDRLRDFRVLDTANNVIVTLTVRQSSP